MKYEYELIKDIKFTFKDIEVMREFLTDLWDMGLRFIDKRKTVNSVLRQEKFVNIYIKYKEIYINVSGGNNGIDIEDFLKDYPQKETIFKVKEMNNKTIKAFLEGKTIIACEKRWESKCLREILRKRRIDWRSGVSVMNCWASNIPFTIRYDTIAEGLCYPGVMDSEKAIPFRELLDWRRYYEG